jgi:sulfatase maturation enzyme AslB (radical SAM superfamily)
MNSVTFEQPSRMDMQTPLSFCRLACGYCIYLIMMKHLPFSLNLYAMKKLRLHQPVNGKIKTQLQ